MNIVIGCEVKKRKFLLFDMIELFLDAGFEKVHFTYREDENLFTKLEIMYDERFSVDQRINFFKTPMPITLIPCAF